MVAPTATMMVAPTATMVAHTPMAAAVISSGKLLSTARAIALYDACESAIEVKLATYKKMASETGPFLFLETRKKRTCPNPPSPKRLANRPAIDTQSVGQQHKQRLMPSRAINSRILG